MNLVIGRAEEKKNIDDILSSSRAELIAVYGRRRVGKTFLIREYCRDKGTYFELIGQYDTPYKSQLKAFTRSVEKAFPGIPVRHPENWKEAFQILTYLIKQAPKTQPVIIFLDEFPWLASRRSGALQALDHEWNSEWSQIGNLKVIVCGSAASWMLEKLIFAKGGLHNRLTDTMHLRSLSLGESQYYLKMKGVRLSSMQLLELYMVIGGVPFYLDLVKKGQSSSQIVNELCFQPNKLLFSEFENIFRSLFENAEIHIKIIREIAKNNNGLRRQELLEKLKIKSGGHLNKKINELKASGFIDTFIPFGNKRKDYTLRIIDEYVLFYLQWIEPMKTQIRYTGHDFWLSILNTPKYNTWSGLAFEAVCLKHIRQIAKSLEIDRVICGTGRWQHRPTKGSRETGAQIDLLLDRVDNTINLCEVKFSQKPYTIDKQTAKNLGCKRTIFEKYGANSKQVFITFITTKGLKNNEYSMDLIDSQVVLEDLFLHANG